MIKFSRAINLLLVSAMLLGLISACGQTEEAIPDPTEAPTAAEPTVAEPVEQERLRVALVLIGPISDGSFNGMAYEGLMMIKEELGVEVAYAESVPPAEFDETYRGFSEEGYDIIIGHGFEFGEPAAKIAPEYPGIYYLVNNGNVSGPNVASLEPLFEEGRVSGWCVGRPDDEDEPRRRCGWYGIPDHRPRY